jgi:hypothetical protein
MTSDVLGRLTMGRLLLSRLKLDADAGFTLSHFFVLAVAHQALVASNQQSLNGFGF